MKTNDITASGIKNDTNNAFTIAATGKAFKILSDGLYSDKITAIIRELSCNAYDSHVAAGKLSMPFDVHLPTYDEKWFSVTDFGTGISDEDINKIYTRYFASTKTGSNDFVGQLGLGSKSPFSYTREFKVRSRVNGLERTYRMYFDDTDTPRVEFLYEKDCAAAGLPPSGLDVSFDVNDSDMSRFRSRAVDVFSWFEVTPNITGPLSDTKIDSLIKGMAFSGWLIRTQKGYSTIPPIALMGNVAYPIDPNNIEKISELERSLLSMPVVIRFDIGDLEVSASRESLGYDKKTQAAIIVRCQTIAAEIHAHYDSLIKKFDTKWEARRFYDQVFGISGSNRYQMKELFKGFSLTWKDGTVIDGSYAKIDLTQVYDNSGHGYRVHTGAAGKLVLNRVRHDQFKEFEQACCDKSLIVFNDCERGGLNRVKHWAKTALADGRITVYDKPDIVTWEDLRGMLGNPPVQTSSSMPSPTKLKIAKATMMAYVRSDYGKHRWTDVSIDMNQGGYWIDAVNKDPISPFGSRVDVSQLLVTAKRLNFIPADTKVYAPKGAMRKKIKNLKNWVNIVDFLTQKVDTEWRQDVVDSVATVIAWKDAMRKSGCNELSYDTWDLRDKTGLMQKVVEMDLEMSAVSNSVEYQRMSSIRTLGEILGVKLSVGKPDEIRLQIATGVANRYPILRVLDYRQWRDNFQTIVEYVNLVDANYVFYALTDPKLSPIDD